jgi:hypothetical protein
MRGLISSVSIAHVGMINLVIAGIMSKEFNVKPGDDVTDYFTKIEFVIDKINHDNNKDADKATFEFESIINYNTNNAKWYQKLIGRIKKTIIMCKLLKGWKRIITGKNSVKFKKIAENKDIKKLSKEEMKDVKAG